MTARHLEANGIATVIIGSARDVVEQCGVPRFLFTDFPLGNPCGQPENGPMQREIVEIALTLLQTACYARTTVQAPFVWPGDASWRQTYMEIRPGA